MQNIRERFQAMIDELEQQPKIHLLYSQLNDPIVASGIDSVEEKLGFKLGETILSFYQQMNGAEIYWIHHDSPNYEEGKFANWTPENKDDFGWQPDGSISLESLEGVIFDNDWEDIIWDEDDEGEEENYGGEDVDLLTLKQSFKPFDIYSESTCMAFKLDSGDPDVLMLNDEYLSHDNSKVIDLPLYLELVFRTRGAWALKERFLHDTLAYEKPRVPLSSINLDDLPILDFSKSPHPNAK